MNQHVFSLSKLFFTVVLSLSIPACLPTKTFRKDGATTESTAQTRNNPPSPTSTPAPTGSQAVNVAPVARNQSLSINEDMVGTGSLSATDANNNSLTYTIVTRPANGTLILNAATGAYTYTPIPNATEGDGFSYKASDGSLESNVATVSITVVSVNDAPVAQNRSLSLQEDVAGGGNLLATDAESDPFIYVLVASPAHGTVSVSNNGAYTYTPASNFHGTDSFTYKATGGSLESNIATVSITVASVNDAPVAQNRSLSLQEDIAGGGNLLATDPDNDPLTYVLVAPPTNGNVSVSATGAYTYTPSGNFNGGDSFTYKATDGTLFSNVATVTVTISEVNDLPVAQNRSSSGNEDTVLSGFLLATDSETAQLTYSLVSPATKGTVTVNATTGSYVYSPNANTNGTDSFTYKASAGTQDSNVAIVSLNIAAVNDAPIAQNGNLEVAYGGSGTGNLVANDIDSGSLTFIKVSNPTKGTLTINSATGAYTYNASAGASGLDSFTYKANDSSLDSNISTVSINILSPPPDPPTQLSCVLSATSRVVTPGDPVGLTLKFTGIPHQVFLDGQEVPNGWMRSTSFHSLNINQSRTITAEVRRDNLSSTCNISISATLPPPSLACSLESNPPVVLQGTGTQLSFKLTGTASRAGINEVADPTFSRLLSPPVNQVIATGNAPAGSYVALVQDASSTNSCSAIVERAFYDPSKPICVGINAFPSDIVAGQQVEFQVSSANPSERATLSDGTPMTWDNRGYFKATVTPQATTDYTATVTGPFGTDTCQSKRVNVLTPPYNSPHYEHYRPLCRLYYSPRIVAPGEEVMIYVNAAGVLDGVEFDGKNVDLNLLKNTGKFFTVISRPDQSKTYRIKLRGMGMETFCEAAVEVTANPSAQFCDISRHPKFGNPIVIRTVADLRAMTSDNHYELANDLTLPQDYQPHALLKNVVFNGKSRKISGLKVTATNYGAGLFSKVEDSIITDLALQDPSVVGPTAVGSVAGDVQNSTLCNITVANPRVGTRDTFYSGGVVAVARSSSLYNISVQGGEVVAQSYAGGVVGSSAFTDMRVVQASAHVILYQGYGGGILGSGGNGTFIREGLAQGFVDSGAEGGKASYVGGLVGAHNFSIYDSAAIGAVKGFAYVGGLVGTTADGTISNSHAYGTVYASVHLAGGFVGAAQESFFERNSASGHVSGKFSLGGFVGHALHGAHFRQCRASGNIQLNDESSMSSGSYLSAGGFAGSIGFLNYFERNLFADPNGSFDFKYISSLSDSSASGNVTFDNTPTRYWAGGLVGVSRWAMIANSFYAGGAVKSLAPGGLVALQERSSVINSYWDRDFAGQSLSPGGGIGKSHFDMFKQATYQGFDFSSIWTIREGTTYPQLR
jgi:VCBS repeat-containing protein